MKINISLKKASLVFFLILMFGIFWRFFSLLSFPDSQTLLEKGDPLIPIKVNETLQQKFVANRENLSKIELLMRTPGLRPGDNLKMQIADENCQKILRTGTLSQSYLAASNLYEFNFDKIPSSKGKTFCMLANFKSGKSKTLQFFTQENKNPQFPVSNISANQTDPQQALSLRTSYVNNYWWQNLGELSQRISQYKPWFLKNIYLDLSILLFLILSVILIVILISM